MANVIETKKTESSVDANIIYPKEHKDLIIFRQENLSKSFRDTNTTSFKISTSEAAQEVRQKVSRSNTSGDIGYNEFSYDKLTPILISMLKDEVFESGVSTPSERFVKPYLKQDNKATMDWLNTVFMKNIRNPHILIGILHMISHFRFKEVYPAGPTMAGFALIRKNDLEIWDYAVKAFENWGDPECIDILEELHITEPWLKVYVDEVIMYLKEF